MNKRKISLGSGSHISAIQLPIAYTPEGAAAATGSSLSRILTAIANRELSARMDGEDLILEDDELRRWIRTFPAVGRESVSA
jgi:hypothetical protein